jgi:hypothetical protein
MGTGGRGLLWALLADSASQLFTLAAKLFDDAKQDASVAVAGATTAAVARAARSSSFRTRSGSGSAASDVQHNAALMLAARGFTATGKALAAFCACSKAAIAEAQLTTSIDIAGHLATALKGCLIGASILQAAVAGGGAGSSTQQQLVQQLQQETAEAQAALPSTDEPAAAAAASSSSSSSLLPAAFMDLLPGLGARLVACGEALAALCPVPLCCNNPGCVELRGASELQLVAGKGSVCSRCR